MPKGIYPRSPRKKKPVAERFWALVERRGPAECWPFRGTKLRDGHGLFNFGERNQPAHRVAWTLENGPIPVGMLVRHKVCDNPPCCNVRHMMLGTHADNMADKVGHGRQARGIQHGQKIRGERHGNAKLTAPAVLQIRQLVAEGRSRAEIASQFGIHRNYVSLIVAGRRWGWL
jgi:HNH endonuclease